MRGRAKWKALRSFEQGTGGAAFRVEILLDRIRIDCQELKIEERPAGALNQPTNLRRTVPLNGFSPELD